MTKFEKVIKGIEESNETFNNMTSAEKRVEIARDVLLRIEIGNINSYSGLIIDINIFNHKKGSLKEVFNSTSSCSVCAKGGLFMAYVGRVNDLNIDDLLYSEKGTDDVSIDKLSEIFTIEQLSGIEAAFEGKIYSWAVGDKSFLRNCENYKNLNSTDEDTLISICKNIIKHKGEFVPTNYVSPKAKIK